MNAGQENHDVTHRDIALLLADAADEVEVGMAPVQAVVRGGRRRKTRRWAVGAAAALVIATSTASLAVAGLQGEDGNRGEPVATQPPTTEERDVYKPQRTELAKGIEGDHEWRVYIDVWAAPRDDAEAGAQLAAMSEYEETPVAPIEVGKNSFFVRGGENVELTEGVFTQSDTQSGKDIRASEFRLENGSGSPLRLVVGKVAKATQRVTCAWKDGTTTEVRRLTEGSYVVDDGQVIVPSGKQVIRPVAGSPVDWFVCVVPKGTAYKSVKVTK
jgi:hypothetical protein